MSNRAWIMGCPVDRLDMDETVRRCQEAIDGRVYTQHMAINAAKLVSFQQDPRLRAVVAGCGLVNADGQSVVWASRLLGDPLPERVAGIDLMRGLLSLAERRGYRVFILGARREVLEEAVRKITLQHPDLVVAGYRDGYFRDPESDAVCAEIRDAKPDILFVAMSSPRKEYWLGQYGEGLGVPFVMGVGGAVDVVAGVTRRAPPLMQRLGLEWLYRLAQEPARLARRYLVANTRFLILLGRELIGRPARREAP